MLTSRMEQRLDLLSVTLMLGGMGLLVASLVTVDLRLAVAGAAVLLPSLVYGLR